MKIRPNLIKNIGIGSLIGYAIYKLSRLRKEALKISMGKPVLVDIGMTLPDAYGKFEIPIINEGNLEVDVVVENIKVISNNKVIAESTGQNLKTSVRILPLSLTKLGPFTLRMNMADALNFSSSAVTLVEVGLKAGGVPIVFKKPL